MISTPLHNAAATADGGLSYTPCPVALSCVPYLVVVLVDAPDVCEVVESGHILLG